MRQSGPRCPQRSSPSGRGRRPRSALQSPSRCFSQSPQPPSRAASAPDWLPPWRRGPEARSRRGPFRRCSAPCSAAPCPGSPAPGAGRPARSPPMKERDVPWPPPAAPPSSGRTPPPLSWSAHSRKCGCSCSPASSARQWPRSAHPGSPGPFPAVRSGRSYTAPSTRISPATRRTAPESAPQRRCPPPGRRRFAVRTGHARLPRPALPPSRPAHRASRSRAAAPNGQAAPRCPRRSSSSAVPPVPGPSPQAQPPPFSERPPQILRASYPPCPARPPRSGPVPAGGCFSAAPAHPAWRSCPPRRLSARRTASTGPSSGPVRFEPPVDLQAALRGCDQCG